MGHGLDAEHPLCDRIQLIMLMLFFSVWGIDAFIVSIFGYSTIITHVLAFPLLLGGTILFLGLSFYLVLQSHKAVFEPVRDTPMLVDSGVYSWVRHPMYLGIMLFCLSFIFVSVSLISIAIWIALFVFYDRMATFEEKNLIKILGERYKVYQVRVSKWIPGL